MKESGSNFQQRRSHMTKLPKVLVGSPTAAPYAYCLPDWVARVKELTYPNKTAVLVDNSETEAYDKTIDKYGVKAVKDKEFVKDSRLRLPHSRNILRRMVLDEGYDYFLSLEQDVIPPVNVIELLIRHNKKMVSGVYYKYFNIEYKHEGKPVKIVRKLMPLLAGYIPGINQKMDFLGADDVERPRCFPIRFCGLGCVLIHRDVLAKVPFRADITVKGHDDIWFSNDVFDQGFRMYVDTGVKCKHMISGKPSGLFDDVLKEFNPSLLTK